MENVDAKLKEMMLSYGTETVRAAAESLLNISDKKIPMTYSGILNINKLEDTIAGLEAGIADSLAAGKLIEAAYLEKASLYKKKLQLETEIKLAEADAIMEIRGDGKNQYAMVNGEQIPMPNETARDAYRRSVSGKYRRQLSEIDGDIASIDINIARAREKSGALKEANESLRARAHVQAALLNYLA